MMYWLNVQLSQCYNVYHIDGNKLNASRENLAFIL